ncbi:kinesin-like protein KIN-10C isoform X1 [Helianthus annuus]|uniref:kinesin-like protein KIN-10C isoform X1 n=1 Tax=Helianthus annuus TaxID=4232 RepID=UPI000B8F99F1|nr:kinesin-like protein KIN-10C isoform X1 [Helianthus annuus]
MANSNLCTPTKHSSDNSISMVRVIARVRPFLPQDGSKESLPCISSLDSSGSEVTVHLKDPYSCRNENYKLDSFYGQEDKNVREIFEREVMPLIPAVVNGSNATVFAYGATGSGKTFIMQGNDEVAGVMPMATASILSMCEKMGGKSVEVSYYEIYNERCYDLLEVKAKEIAILDDKDGRPHLIGLSKIPISSMLDFQETLSCGLQRRKVASTGLNDVSSRSHGILVISVSNGHVIGKLNLIDLAGFLSLYAHLMNCIHTICEYNHCMLHIFILYMFPPGNEDNKKSGNEGVRLHESAKINQSLFALSQVIYALNNNTSRIPYRDSKLTRILQDSLGGTSHAVMVACLNPGEYEQSVRTVSLAARSRRVSNFVHSASKHTPKLQVDMEARLRTWLESKGKAKKQDPSTPRSVNRLNTIKTSGKRMPIHTLSEQRVKKVETETTPMCMRKVLYPINTNVNVNSPKQHSVAADDNTNTPLNKLKAMSCNLKSTLAQEYINFLNTAGKVELLQLKGIGEKMADYILELRDETPLKSLNDLEKIGLSSKQVAIMFGRTAKGLFD